MIGRFLALDSLLFICVETIFMAGSDCILRQRKRFASTSAMAACCAASIALKRPSRVPSGTQTINEASGQLQTINGTQYRVFNVTSYNANNGNILTINGDESGTPVVFNFGFDSNVNLGDDVVLNNGLTPNQILWNFTTSGQNISLNNNASSYPGLAFQGILLARNDALSVTNANLIGHLFGGDSHDMQIVSGTTITTDSSVPAVPEPSSIMLLSTGLAGFGFFVRRRKRS